MENETQPNIPQAQPLPQTTTPIQSKTNWSKILIFIILGLVIVVLLVFAGMQFIKKPTPKIPLITVKPTIIPTQPITSPIINITNPTYDDVSTDMNTWLTFTNTSLGFSFKYPSQWGEVQEKIMNSTTDNINYTGKTYSLYFSKIGTMQTNSDSFVYGSGVSADFSMPRGGTEGTYKGDTNLAKGVTATIWARPSNCIIPESAHLYYGRINFNLPGKEISGVRLLMPVVSQNQVTIFDEEYNSLNPQEQEKFCIIENIDKEANLYIKELETKQLDELSQKQLLIFKQILSSAEVL